MIAIIGGGISGLSLAVELQKWCEKCIVFESSLHTGGVMQTETIDGYQLEYGANSLLADEEIIDYLKKLGLEKDIIYPEPVSKNRYIFKDGKYRKLPANPFSLLLGNFLSPASKLAVIKELFSKPTPATIETESLSDFFNRHFNQEITDYIVAPFVTGISAGNVEELLVSRTFPSLLSYENQYGSILRGFIKNKNHNKKHSVYFTNGMQTLIKRLTEKVKDLKTGATVKSIEKSESGYIVRYDIKGKQEEFYCNAVVLSIPAYSASLILNNISPALSEAVKRINYAPIIKVFLGYKQTSIKYKLDGFGALNPPCENQYTLGSIWSSSIYKNVAPRGHYLLTALVGGSIYAGHTAMKDDFIIHKTTHEISEYFSLPQVPEFTHLKRFDKGIPQYDKNILYAEAEAKNAEKENIYINANWLGGAGLSDCIRKSKRMATKITESLSGITDYQGCC